MKALLVDAQGSGSVGRAFVEWIPAGIRSIAGILEGHQTDYDLILIEELLKKSEKTLQKYDLALLTGMSSDFEIIKKAAKKLAVTEVPLIVGGPITFNPVEVISHLGAKISIIGEGEKSFSKIMNAGLKDGHIPEYSELDQIEGIAFRAESGGIQINKKNGYQTKEEIAKQFPSVSIIEEYPFHNEIMVVIEILRGCSNFYKPRIYHNRECLDNCNKCNSPELSERLTCPIGTPPGCGFCSVGGLYGPPRSRDQNIILREIKGLIDHGATKITILDPDPLDYKREELVAPMPLTDPKGPMPNYKEIERLGELIWSHPEVASGEVTVTVRDVKATLVNYRSAGLLKKYFPRSVFGIGCESGSKDHSTRLGRPYSPEIILMAVKTFNKYGIKPKINMILGLPWQDEKSTTETIELMKILEPYISHFDFTRFESLPASGFEDHPSDTGPLKDPNSLALLEYSNRLQKRLFEKYIGESLKVVIGTYPTDEKGLRDNKEKGKTPRRGFRQLVGLLGYPIFDNQQLSLYATVIRIKGENHDLRSGDTARVKIDGVAQIGFRMVLEGNIID